jgi:hypothetical protein
MWIWTSKPAFFVFLFFFAKVVLLKYVYPFKTYQHTTFHGTTLNGTIFASTSEILKSIAILKSSVKENNDSNKTFWCVHDLSFYETSLVYVQWFAIFFHKKKENFKIQPPLICVCFLYRPPCVFHCSYLKFRFSHYNYSLSFVFIVQFSIPYKSVREVRVLSVVIPARFWTSDDLNTSLTSIFVTTGVEYVTLGLKPVCQTLNDLFIKPVTDTDRSVGYASVLIWC